MINENSKFSLLFNVRIFSFNCSIVAEKIANKSVDVYDIKFTFIEIFSVILPYFAQKNFGMKIKDWKTWHCLLICNATYFLELPYCL